MMTVIYDQPIVTQDPIHNFFIHSFLRYEVSRFVIILRMDLSPIFFLKVNYFSFRQNTE